MPPPIHAHLIADERTWDRIAPEWAELCEAIPAAATPLHFAWLRNWWRIYGDSCGNGVRPLRLLTFWRVDRLIGALPLYEPAARNPLLDARRILFLSTGEAEREETCPDYLDLLCRPGEEAACLKALKRSLVDLPWDFLELADIPEHSVLLRDRSWWDGPIEVTPHGVCPIANMENGFEAYLKRLSPKTRSHARQYLRAAERAGASIELAAEGNSAEFFDDLVRLHQERWAAEGKPGCFAAPRFTEFHHALAKQWVPSGRAILGRLSIEGRPAAVLYGFVSGAKFDFYQSGIKRDAQSPLQSPGTTATLMLISKLTERGVTRFDFLRGSASYKERLATEHCSLFSIRAAKPNLLTLAHQSSRHLARAIRRISGLHREPATMEPFS